MTRHTTITYTTHYTLCTIHDILCVIYYILYTILTVHCSSLQASTASALRFLARNTANPPTNIVDFRGFDSSIILILRGGIPRPIGDFPENSSQAMLVGTMLVG